MTRPTITIHNALTDEIIIREMTVDEYADYNALTEKAQIEKEAETVKAEAKAALLNRLGITEEEAKLLLGSN